MPDNKKAECPIGVFDSGMGGLTVLRELVNQLPQESYVYLGDTARLPYGTKSPNTVMQYAAQMTRLLTAYNIKLLVIACNTATSAALPHLQQSFPHLPIIGVVEPGAHAAATATKKNKILLLATETTVNSGIYQSAIQAHNPDAEVYAQSCGLLVTLAEEGLVDDKITALVLKKYLAPVADQIHRPDCAILGCTHFPIFKKAISLLLGHGVHIVDSAKETANAVYHALRDLCLQKVEGSSTIQFLVTDLPQRFSRIGEIFFGQPLDTKAIHLIDIHDAP